MSSRSGAALFDQTCDGLSERHGDRAGRRRRVSAADRHPGAVFSGRLNRFARSVGLALGLGLAAFGALAADPLRVFHTLEGVWPPFMPHEGRPGLQWELMTAALDEAGLPFEAVISSTSRARAMFAKGRIDAEAASPHWFDPAEENGVFSAPLFISEDVLVGSPGKDFSFFDGPETLADRVVVGIVGYGYPGVASWGERIDVASEAVMVARFAAGALDDVGVCNRLTCAFWAEKQGVRIAFGPIYDAAPVAVRVRRARADVVPRIDAAIGALRARGELAAIAARYDADPSLIAPPE